MPRKLSWFQSKPGMSGATDLDSAQLTYYRQKNGNATTGSINDNLFAVLGALGYTGSITDRLRNFYKVETQDASNDFDYLENLFYGNVLYDFDGTPGPGGATTGTSMGLLLAITYPT